MEGRGWDSGGPRLKFMINSRTPNIYRNNSYAEHSPTPSNVKTDYESLNSGSNTQRAKQHAKNQLNNDEENITGSRSWIVKHHTHWNRGCWQIRGGVGTREGLYSASFSQFPEKSPASKWPWQRSSPSGGRSQPGSLVVWWHRWWRSICQTVHMSTLSDVLAPHSKASDPAFTREQVRLREDPSHRVLLLQASRPIRKWCTVGPTGLAFKIQFGQIQGTSSNQGHHFMTRLLVPQCLI